MDLHLSRQFLSATLILTLFLHNVSFLVQLNGYDTKYKTVIRKESVIISLSDCLCFWKDVIFSNVFD